jgi:hypothetical protein
MSAPTKINAIIIDPYAGLIYRQEIENSLDGFYEAAKCSCITAVYLNDSATSDCIYVDDEGLLKPIEEQAFFHIEGHQQPYAGIGVLVGTDEGGNSVEPRTNFLEFGFKVRFLTPRLEKTEGADGHERETWGFV